MGKDKQKGGLSSHIQVQYGGGYRRPTRRKESRVNKSAAEIEAAKAKRRNYASEMDFEMRDTLMSADISMGDGSRSNDSENAWDDIDGFDRLPPGEEGMFLDNAGMEEGIYHEIIDYVVPQKKRGDYRTRRDRPQIRTNAWREQIDRLTCSYMEWNSYGTPPLPSDENSVVGSWELTTIDFFDVKCTTFRHMSNAKYTNETLVRHGFIGTSPTKVSVAISIRALEAYRQLHRVCPRLSVQAFSKALCHLHKVPFRRYLADQLDIAFDVYLDILHHVDGQAQQALGRNLPNYNRLHVCPPCMYKIQDEPSLKFSMLVAADGNQSLRLVDSTFLAGDLRPDDRVLRSNRWLQPEEVDKFKDEVKNAKQKHTTDSAEDHQEREDGVEDFAWINDASDGELSQKVADCVNRWRNAGPEARKKMFSLFAIAGIFLVVCRHGHVLVICDMIRSGELMKYPLACLRRLFDLYGSDLALGYDIACAFMTTVTRSTLGAEAKQRRLRGVVPAFHGHSHKRGCQIDWHPMYIEGAGTEDWEECERTFKSSNELASVTRLATPFHRHQQIDQHFDFHDMDKYAAAGEFMYRNYRHALKRIKADTPKLAAISEKLNIRSTDYATYLNAEREYLASLKTEPAEVAHTLNYMEALQRLHDARESDEAKAKYDHLDYGIISLGWKSQEIARVKTRYRTTWSRFLAAEENVSRLEEELNIECRWSSDSPQYREALVMMNERQYRRALDSLELLVVQRLFELTKLGMSGTGYKMREKIARALKARCKAIKTALEHYNTCAMKLNPPRPPLTWTKVTEAVYLADLDMLRDARQDIRTLKWAQPAYREAMNVHFGLERAKEEVKRLNIEIRRLLTFMRDDHIDYFRAIKQWIIKDPPLAYELSTQWQYRDRIHQVIYKRLQQTAALSGFSGVLQPGLRIGQVQGRYDDVYYFPSWWKGMLAMGSIENGWDDIDDLGEDIGEEDDVAGIIQFMDDLDVSV